MTYIDESSETLILVDPNDHPIGVSGKLDAHLTGQLHRAFSIFLFDAQGRTLVQKRASTKYHSGGQWANTCCGHPRPGEATIEAGERRLMEELGVSAKLHHGFHTHYSARLDSGMTENEFVHVLSGRCGNEAPLPNPDEVSDYQFVALEDLRDFANDDTVEQTVWLRHYLETHFEELSKMRRAIINAPSGSCRDNLVEITRKKTLGASDHPANLAQQLKINP